MSLLDQLLGGYVYRHDYGRCAVGSGLGRPVGHLPRADRRAATGAARERGCARGVGRPHVERLGVGTGGTGGRRGRVAYPDNSIDAIPLSFRRVGRDIRK